MRTIAEFFGEPIYTYTRRQAIEDGVLVQLSGRGYEGDQWIPEMCQEAGFRVPVAVTAEVFWDCIDMTPAAERACNDIKGRLWDVLYMLRHAIRTAPAPTDCLEYEVRIVVKRTQPSLVRLKAIMGPDDDGSPCITVMYPHQD